MTPNTRRFYVTRDRLYDTKDERAFQAEPQLKKLTHFGRQKLQAVGLAG
jgi:hypothetical protein